MKPTAAIPRALLAGCAVLVLLALAVALMVVANKTSAPGAGEPTATAERARLTRLRAGKDSNLQVARAAIGAGDGARAMRFLGRVAEADPEHPDLAELQQRAESLVARERLDALLAEVPTAAPRRRAEIYAELLRSHPEEGEYRRLLEESEAEAERDELRSGAAGRARYARLLRDRFLDLSMDIEVETSGPYNEQLVLTYALMGDVWVHHFRKGNLPEEIRLMGFTRIEFRDGFDYARWMEWEAPAAAETP